HVTAFEPFFPIFRAHPLLFQSVLSLGFRLGLGPGDFERLASGMVGLLTVLLTFEIGRLLYGRRAGLIAALILGLMPYHVIVTRQVLLDGPMTFCATLALYLMARYAMTERRLWLYAAGGPLVLTAAIAGLWALRWVGSWRETLLLSWMAAPLAFFELWPVKGYQYLLPAAPALALLAGRALAALPRRWEYAAVAAVAVS